MRLPGRPTARLRVVALLAAVTFTIELALAPHPGSPRALAIAVGLTLSACLAFARRSPVGAQLAVGAICVAEALLGLRVMQSTSTTVFVAMAFTFCVALWTDLRTTLVSSTVYAALLTVALVVEGETSTLIGDIAFMGLVLTGMPVVAGRVLRSQAILNARLDTQARELEHNRAERERAAVLAERTRIARELHDVVAHDVSVMLVQAQAARRIVPAHPERAREAIAAVESTGREALGELRRLLGVLRRGDEELALAPQPSLGRIETLVGRIRAAGLDVGLKIEGTPFALPPGLDAAAFRVVQEALANVLQHAAARRADVRVAYGPAGVELRVRDDGTAGAGEVEEGRGLVGLRERVALYGGDLRAGRRRSGGFELRALLPVAELAA
ncbi:MAG: sensor histidine kinase [Solirubrobacteraceae bacterium]